MNSAFLQRRHIDVAVMEITVDPASRVVYMTVYADLSSPIPGVLLFQGVYRLTGAT